MTDELETTVVPVTARDGHGINLHHVTGPRAPTREPVLLVHGAGVRANIFRPPEQTTLVDALSRAGVRDDGAARTLPQPGPSGSVRGRARPERSAIAARRRGIHRTGGMRFLP